MDTDKVSDNAKGKLYLLSIMLNICIDKRYYAALKAILGIELHFLFKFAAKKLSYGL